MEDQFEDKQVPEKPKKQGGISMTVVIGVVFGGLIVMVALIFVLFKFMIVPAINQAPAPAVGTEGAVAVKEHDNKKEHGDEEEEDADMSEEEEKKLVFMETGKIIANPKGNFEKYVILNMAMQFIPKDEKLVAELKKEADKVTEWKKLLAGTKEIVTNTFGNYSVEEIGQMRKDSIKVMLFKQLKPLFKEEKIKLKSITLQEFLIQ